MNTKNLFLFLKEGNPLEEKRSEKPSLKNDLSSTLLIGEFYDNCNRL